MFKKITIGLAAFVLIASLATVLHACPNCKGSVGVSGMATGFAWSIAIMLGVPLSIVSAWTIAIRKHLRHINQR